MKFPGVFCLLILAGCSHEAEQKPAVPVDTADFDHNHTALHNVLNGVVDFGMVDYGLLLHRRDALGEYLVTAARVPRAKFDKWPRAERMAFLLNVYNAATLKLLADHHPVKSIKNISTLPPVWSLKVVRLFGGKYSLGDLEHEMIRRQFKSPQVHFALVCGASSCPPLRAEPYTAERLDAQFAEQARAFLSDTNKNRIDLKAKVITLSPIFKWYAEDFGRTETDLLRFIAPHFSEAARKTLEAGGFRIEYSDYDWSLNQQPAQK